MAACAVRGPARWGQPTRAMVFPQTALVPAGRDAERAARCPGDLRGINPTRILCHLDVAAGPLGHDLAGFARLQTQFPDLPMDLELIALFPLSGDLDAEFATHARAVRDAGLRAGSVMVTPSVDRQSTPPRSAWTPSPISTHRPPRLSRSALDGGVAVFFH